MVNDEFESTLAQRLARVAREVLEELPPEKETIFTVTMHEGDRLISVSVSVVRTESTN